MKNLKEINVENIGYSRPRYTKKGYNVLVNYLGSKPIVVETVGECPYGVDQQHGKVSLKLVVTDADTLATLRDIDVKHLQLPDEYRWFSVEDEKPFYYTPFMATQAALRVKIPLNRGRLNVDIEYQDDNAKLASIDDIIPGCKIKCVLEWKQVWIVEKTYGYFWSVKKILILK